MSKQFGQDKIIIMLGAGASCDAGMKNSYQMISEIELLLTKDWEKFKDLYNYIQSSHYHLERIKGVDSKFIIFNIENLVGLLNVIINIAEKNVDVYPLIGSWEKELLIVAGNKLELASEFKKEILTKLKNTWLSPDDFRRKSAYYKKLKETNYNYPLRIFSLNYDMCVEENIGIENIERGFDSEDKIWDYRRYDPSEEQAVSYFLYKLHGSLDWKRDSQNRLTYSDSISSIDPLNMEIIFGIQNKLQSYDPYLFYFYSFREACINADLIVISGYGFLDNHINDNLISAFKLNKSKKLLVNICCDESEKPTIERKIQEILEISKDNIAVVNSTAIEFFNNNLNIDYFKSIFPEVIEEGDILP